MTYAEAHALLHRLPRFADAGAAAYRPGLGRMRKLLATMDNPHLGLRAVHIAGTNGKGSTASFVAAIGTAHGLRVGLHTSPHISDLSERLRLDGVPAPHEWIADAIARHKHVIEQVGPSFFEATVALALLYFAEQRVDLAVVEVGLGGRLDATNVLQPAACGITTVSLDHTELLGGTVRAIAQEKAGIAKAGVPLLTTVDSEEALRAIQSVAGAVGAPVEWVRATCSIDPDGSPGQHCTLHTPLRTYEGVEVGLPGAHQAWNAALAIRLAETVCPALVPADVAKGLREVTQLSGLRGRGEQWADDPPVMVDVAHNAEGWRAALDAVCAGLVGTLYVMVGVMADKEVTALAKTLKKVGAVALPVALTSNRALAPERLVAALKKAYVPAQSIRDAQEALTWYRAHAQTGDRLLVTGSHYAAEAIGKVLESEKLLANTEQD